MQLLGVLPALLGRSILTVQIARKIEMLEGFMQKNRLISGVRTPRVLQATDRAKLSAFTSTSVEVGFTVTRKQRGRACGMKGGEELPDTHEVCWVQAMGDGGKRGQENL